MYALVNCINLYVSCEGLFNPKLEQAHNCIIQQDGCEPHQRQKHKA
jgi:hypothetical protein